MKLNNEQLQSIKEKAEDLGKLFLPFSNTTTKVYPMGERHIVIRSDRYIENDTGKIVEKEFAKGDYTFEGIISILPVSSRKDELEQATMSVISFSIIRGNKHQEIIPLTQREMSNLTSLLGGYKKILVSALSFEKRKEKEIVR